MNDFSKIFEITKNMKLLYIEDEETLRDETVGLFETLFLEVISAIDGEDALEKFYENEVDLVVSEVVLPKVDAFEMLNRMRALDKDIPILLLSSKNETSCFRKSIELDVDGYMLKPLEADEFMEALARVIEKITFQEEFNNNLLFLQQYRELTDSSSAVSQTDAEGVITYVNDEFVKLSGYSKDELIGNKHNIIRHPDNPATMYSDLWHTIKYQKKAWSGILRNLSKEGKSYYLDTMIKPILDKDNNIIEYISTKIDVTAIMSQKKQLFDYIESSAEPILALVSIEGFSNIEKFYGHLISQNINDNFAKELKKYIPTNLGFDKLFSLDDGEFAFICDLGSSFKNLDEKEYRIFIETFVEELQSFQQLVDELSVDVGDIDYDVSILISLAHGKECLENVKYGMKHLKKNKQGFILANDLAQKEQKKAENNLNTLKMIKRAIDSSNVISYFQPIVCNRKKEIVKYESLVRLIDENDNIISPFFFLDTAKKGKYYAKITSIVLENSFNALEMTDKDISINISVLDIEKVMTRDKIYELLAKYKSSAHRIIFELLEDEDVRNFEEITEFISKVKEFGVRIAIDDFGAGYSNFSRLLEYQPDILKIDGSLIKNIESDTYSLSVVKTIVSFAKGQNIEVVAEYVENENIYNILKDMEIEYFQGYHFGAPAPM